MIDLRSDTITRPTAAMRRAMAEAPVGDDVFGDYQAVHRLEERFASLFGKAAAVFVPSGTMANQLAIRAQTEPGDEVITHAESHVSLYESGAPAALSGVTLRYADGPRGTFTAEAVRACVRPRDTHYGPAALVTVENTHNRGGGRVWPLEQLRAVREECVRLGVRVHLDGARIWNAHAASGVSLAEYGSLADTVSACFSKGLGAPVGSALAGDERTIARARRFRKMFGGGMRQAGILAAGCLHALDHHVARLAEDHAKARALAERLARVPCVTVDPAEVETNLVYFGVDPRFGGAEAVCERFGAAGVAVLSEGPHRVRAVTHLDVTADEVERAGEVMARSLA
ncbi:MAG TPA: GntG family PLP-dependent aldolase [Phycisphaerales bacterium]|nr:GntG family PLP-dependent aldolase [Phycisphaerales bacterium]